MKGSLQLAMYRDQCERLMTKTFWRVQASKQDDDDDDDDADAEAEADAKADDDP